jgi:hypothetical protein
MPNTLGYHIVLATYGRWLPGDDRGSWSDAWDEQIGYYEPHMLHPGDPVRFRMAEERMKHPPVLLTPAMMRIVETTIADCAGESDWTVEAASIEPTHTHLQLTYTPRDIDNTVKWLKDCLTKAIHRDAALNHPGPVWCKNKWRSFIYDPKIWHTTTRYIERHNERRGLGPRPYLFIKPRPPAALFPPTNQIAPSQIHITRSQS